MQVFDVYLTWTLSSSGYCNNMKPNKPIGLGFKKRHFFDPACRCHVPHCASVLLQDPYLHRPLPYLIGSEEFEHSDDVGVGALEQGCCRVIFYRNKTISDIEFMYLCCYFKLLDIM